MNEIFEFNFSSNIENFEEVTLFNVINENKQFLKNLYEGNNLINNWKNDIIVIIDYFKGWNRYTSVFLKEKEKENEEHNKMLSEKIKFFDKFAILEIWRKHFNSFIDNLYWYCPIEYYQKWLIDNNLIDGNEFLKIEKFSNSLSPYAYVSSKINDKFKKVWEDNNINRFFIYHKEKFGVWVFLEIYIENNWEEAKNFYLLKEQKPEIFYSLVYHIELYLNEYNKYNYLTRYDYEDEWKNSIWL